jgi:hypothetical protein
LAQRKKKPSRLSLNGWSSPLYNPEFLTGSPEKALFDGRPQDMTLSLTSAFSAQSKLFINLNKSQP